MTERNWVSKNLQESIPGRRTARERPRGDHELGVFRDRKKARGKRDGERR